MPKYIVKLVSEETKFAFVEVEAEDKENAQDQAYEYENGELDWTYARSEYYVEEVVERYGNKDF
jgi:hypothetical protein